jgi:DNA-binding CsgD family transcriptional regulator
LIGEEEVLELSSQGHSEREIAEILKLNDTDTEIGKE